MREPTAPAYYDRRAPEYDDWYLGDGLYADRERDGFDEELETVAVTLAGLSARPHARRRLRHRLPDPSPARRGHRARPERAHARGRRARVSPAATLVQGDALALPFPDDCFDRVVTGHFYGHLDEEQRATFLREAAASHASSSSSTRRARTRTSTSSGRRAS